MTSGHGGPAYRLAAVGLVVGRSALFGGKSLSGNVGADGQDVRGLH